MPLSINSNRYVCTVIKTGVSDFSRFSGEFVHYLLRDESGNLFSKKGGSVAIPVQFPSQSGKLPRTFSGDLLSVAESSDGFPVVSVIGHNPYKAYRNEFNCVYYSYFDSGVWKTVGLESCIKDVFPTFAVVVVTSSGDKFFAMQVGPDVCVYSIGTSSIDKKSQLSDFTLVDAKAFGSDIALFVCKNETLHPYQMVYESELGTSMHYHKNSPVVIICTSLSSFSSFEPFCQNRSTFPALCTGNDLISSNSMFIHGGSIYVASMVYDSSLSAFVPMACVGKENDAWRYFLDVKPFSSETGISDPQICVDSNNVVHVAGTKNGQVMLSYYNRAWNAWSKYDRESYITFDNAVISSSSSSSSSG
jgi:hypothetical protein